MPDTDSGASRAAARYLPIEDYGVVGNLHTVALVSRRGSIDFLAFPRFDAPTVFTALLDQPKGGCFSINGTDADVTHKQMYLPDTAVLLTRYLCACGVAELVDFMPVKSAEDTCAVVRQLTVVRGEMTFELVCAPSFGYAAHGCRTEVGEGHCLFHDPTDEQAALRLTSPVALTADDDGAVRATFHLREKETFSFVLTADGDHSSAASPDERFADTVAYWREWMSRCQYRGRWREAVGRSAMTLKLLTSCQYGAPVAAATFGLPEEIGGSRNWDYRFTWIRDAAFTMYAFLRLGYVHEADDFMAWIQQQPFEDGLQLVYGVDGGDDLSERELDHLEGYRQSQPVRVGNAAAQQRQLDIYGEFIDTVYIYNQNGGSITYDFWRRVEKLIEYVCDHWEEDDHGIWEVRDEERSFLHSRLQCWVALDRALRLVADRSFPSDVGRWQQTRDAIYRDIFENFWDEERQAFVQSKGSQALDASALLMPLMRFCSAQEPRWVATFERIREELTSEPLVFRYRLDGGSSDGLDGEEATFSICSFWYIECLARMGQVDEAILNFEKMLGYANHLGLYSEQIGLNGEQLGNFPQAFTHLSLISAAYQIDKQLSGSGRPR